MLLYLVENLTPSPTTALPVPSLMSASPDSAHFCFYSMCIPWYPLFLPLMIIWLNIYIQIGRHPILNLTVEEREWGPKELRGQESHSCPVVAKTSAGLWEGRWGSIVTQSSMQVSDLNEVTLSTKSYVSDSRNEKLKMERRGSHQIVYYRGNRSLAQGTLIPGSDSPSSMTNRISGWFL